MTKDVDITIIGKQESIEDNEVTIKTTGSYHFTNGKHYIQYDEISEEDGKAIRNTLKISPNEVSYRKKDKFNTWMYFEKNEISQMNYPTPYGNLALYISTRIIDVTETQEKIEAVLEYTLSNNNASVSENTLHIIISAK